jgi:hypothetical protein
MDELESLKQAIETFRETLIFLVEQEKIRGEEVSALNDKIDALNKTVTDEIINPSLEAYREEKFKEFSDKYGERLGKYDKMIGAAQSNPEYSATREAFNELADLSDSDRESVDIDSYVDGVEKGLEEYVAEIKASLGLPEETKVEIKSDAEGTEVKADTDGDGKAETVVAETSTEDEAVKEEVKTPDSEEEEEVEIDPELEKQLAAY